MKHSIETQVSAAAFDNKEYINEGGYDSIADYLIENAELQEHGWFWFLGEDEIEEFENNDTIAEQYIAEIKYYLTENFNYKLED
jgi:hypothetical protein